MKWNNKGVLYLLPGLAGFVLFFIAPFFLSFIYSFVNTPLKMDFVGLANFKSLLTNPAYQLGLKNTALFIAISVPLNMAASLALALRLHKLPRGKKVFSLFFLIPLVLPSGSTAFFWSSLFSTQGALNGFLAGLKIAPVPWLESSIAFIIMVLIFLWKNIGYNMILYLSGLSGISSQLYEAGALDGAGAWQSFCHITLPSLRSTHLLVFVMSIVNSFKVFKEIYLIGGSHPDESIYTLQHFMNNMFGNLNYSRLTTATTLFVLIMIIITQGISFLERRGEVG